MNLFSRPNAPFALWLATNPGPAVTWNGRTVASPGFTGDVQALWQVARDAWLPWLVDVVAGDEPTKPHAGIGFAPVFGNFPGGGQANVGSWKDGGIQAFVFTDRLGNRADFCGLDAVHESGHVMGNFSDEMQLVSGVWQYTPGLWMGNVFSGTPLWTVPQLDTLDATFGPAADRNADGVVNMADTLTLRTGQHTAMEAITVARNFGK